MMPATPDHVENRLFGLGLSRASDLHARPLDPPNRISVLQSTLRAPSEWDLWSECDPCRREWRTPICRLSALQTSHGTRHRRHASRWSCRIFRRQDCGAATDRPSVPATIGEAQCPHKFASPVRHSRTGPFRIRMIALIYPFLKARAPRRVPSFCRPTLGISHCASAHRARRG
jgi:hypothetical protein